MERFPKLKTGAVSQYPTGRRKRFGTGIGLFLDGAEQRYRERASAGRRWVIELSKLDEAETAALGEFFRKHRGRSVGFEFEDPLTGEVVSGCRFEDDQAAVRCFGEFDSEMRFAIVEAMP